MESPKRARSRKRQTQPRGVLHTTAPVPDPTAPTAVVEAALSEAVGSTFVAISGPVSEDFLAHCTRPSVDEI